MTAMESETRSEQPKHRAPRMYWCHRSDFNNKSGGGWEWNGRVVKKGKNGKWWSWALDDFYASFYSSDEQYLIESDHDEWDSMEEAMVAAEDTEYLEAVRDCRDVRNALEEVERRLRAENSPIFRNKPKPEPPPLSDPGRNTAPVDPELAERARAFSKGEYVLPTAWREVDVYENAQTGWRVSFVDGPLPWKVTPPPGTSAEEAARIAAAGPFATRPEAIDWCDSWVKAGGRAPRQGKKFWEKHAKRSTEEATSFLARAAAQERGA